jgi:hypothetical protein
VAANERAAARVAKQREADLERQKELAAAWRGRARRAS